jgi:hypothetical protein
MDEQDQSKFYISNIKINASNKEDNYFMPLADISIAINAIEFFYTDYIDPFINEICKFEIKKSQFRHGNDKSDILSKIQSEIDVDYKLAVKLFNKAINKINFFIKTTPQLRKDFPPYMDLMLLAQQNNFEEHCQIDFNFLYELPNAELHIRCKSVKEAIEKFMEFNSTGYADETYTSTYLKKILKDYYPGHYLSRDIDDECWIIYQPSRSGGYILHRFKTLRDADRALPLPDSDGGY